MNQTSYSHDVLAIEYPDIAREWDNDKNSPLTANDVFPGSTKKSWWICDKGHSYYARIDHRIFMHAGCPYCHGKKVLKGENDLQTLFPDLAAEWDYSRNDKTPDCFFSRSNKAVYWLCPFCGYSYKAIICDRTLNYSSCPNCAKEKGTSFQEQSLLFYLKQITKAENRYRLSGTEIDIFLPEYNAGIEYNGWYYHKNRHSQDLLKMQKLQEKGVKIIVVRESFECSSQDGEIIVKCSENGRVNKTDLEDAIVSVFSTLGIDHPAVDLDRDHIHIKEQYIISMKESNLANKYPNIAKQWNYELNGCLKPENFLYASNHSVFWKCDVCGNDYQTSICKRTVGNQGCPYCAGKKVKKGFNDLKTKYPEIAAQWSLNNNCKKPEDYVAGSDVKVWWHCGVCGEDWKASISSRTRMNTGCPVCAGKKVLKGFNDLASEHPDLLDEWDTEKNRDLKPTDITSGSNKAVWWKCRICGNEWKAVVASRVRGRGCPCCGLKKRTRNAYLTKLENRGSLFDKYPGLLKEWDYEKNNNILPQNVAFGSKLKVWWKCAICDYSWQAVIYSRTGAGRGCPMCGIKKCRDERMKTFVEKRGSLLNCSPEIASEWDHNKNGTLDPSEITAGSKKTVWWKCSTCGCSWEASVQLRFKGYGKCPICNPRNKTRR